ncbi:hypothetical protein QE152_g19497 [Popillia japonica]|uniref:Uncharacterized protein n=1 Tax=Popillia japonica TaxID=7064 RepID=A0AAW1KSV9_POPJA
MAQINLSMRDYCETIPHFDFDGDPLNISTFISSYDSFVQILARPNDAAFNSFLFRAIISKLKGKAAQIASVRNTTSWDALRTLLVNTFSDRRNELTLISELQRLEQYSNESAIDFGERCLNHNNQPQFKVEELFYQEDPYQDEAAALDYNYYYPEEYTYEIPQTEENIKTKLPH